MGNSMTTEELRKVAKDRGYSNEQCMECQSMSLPTSDVCQRCIAKSEEFSAAVNEFLLLAKPE